MAPLKALPDRGEALVVPNRRRMGLNFNFDTCSYSSMPHNTDTTIEQQQLIPFISDQNVGTISKPKIAANRTNFKRLFLK